MGENRPFRSHSSRARAWLSPARIALAMLIVWIAVGCLVNARRNLTDLGTVLATDRMLSSLLGEAPSAAVPAPASVGYALALTAIAGLSPGTRKGLACWGDPAAACSGGTLPMVVALQFVAALACVGLMWRTARILSGIPRIAVVATILACLSMRLGPFAGTLRGDIFYLFFLCSFMACLSAAAVRGSTAGSLAAGVALGCAALFQPLAAIMLPAAAIGLALTAADRQRHTAGVGRAWLAPILFVAAAAATSAVLLLSAAGFKPFAVLEQQAGADFGRRAAFVGLDGGIWLAGVTLPVPLLGEALEAFLPTDAVRKLAVGAAPGSLALHGHEIAAQAVTRAHGNGLDALALMLRQTVIDQPLAYLLSLPVVIARGLFAGGGLIALLGLLHVAGMARFACAAGRAGLHLTVLAPVAVLFAANALLTGNEFWLNPLLPFVYAYAIAYVAGGP